MIQPEKITILNVEDDMATATLIKRSLSQQGYVVESVESGEKAIALCNPDIHQIVVCDYQMPDMDGCQIIMALKAKYPQLPIVMLTGMGNEKIVVKAFRVGAADYLIKDNSNIYLEMLPPILQSVLRTANLTHENRRQQEQLEAHNRQLQNMAQNDSLTGLANYAFFHESLQRAVARASRNGEHMAVMMVDLDGFKKINDHYGHPAGDMVLKKISSRFKKALRESDLIARMGGDEFAIILNNLKHPQDATIVAEKLLRRIRYPLVVEGERLKITMSIGIDSYPTCGQDAKQLVKNADAAMYMAKKDGKNNYQFFTPELNNQAIENARLEKDLNQALRREELVLYFQPKFSGRNPSAIVGAEALIRWNHPHRGRVSPDVFIPIAERSALIQEIGLWVLETACRQGKAWLDQGLAPLLLSVNISPFQLCEKSFADKVFEIVEMSGFSADLLELEITESALIRHIDRCRKTLVRLRERGIKISMDDFGTGFSSIAHLRQLPVDILKIDKSLVRNITTNPEEAAITSGVIHMAHNINMKVVAEGVETKEQLQFLQEKRCDTMQGYFLSHPLAAADFGLQLLEKAA